MFVFLSGVVCLLSLLVDGIHSEALNLSSFDRCVPRTDGYVCYRITDSPDLWDTGGRVCNALNMTLLEILTESENTAVHDLLLDRNMVDSWLGALQSSESWRWLDGIELGDQGCFVDNVTNPDMEYSVDFPLNNSVTNCIAHCKSLLYAYAGVVAGTRCECGDAFGRYGQDGANCGIQCPGNVSQSCGGNLPTSQQVYAVNGAPANWLGGQPNNNNGYQSCATMDAANGYNWQDVFCRDSYKAICEIPFVNNRCSDARATLVNGRCLMTTNEEVNYFISRFTCRSLGGDLAMHLTSTDSLAIARWLNLASNATVQFFVGLVKWQWRWQTGGEFLYTNWKYDQPTGPNFNCVTIKQNSGDWVAIGCETNHLYICQKSNATLKVTAPPYTLAPSTTPKRTAPPPLPPITRGSSSFPTLRSPTDQSHPLSNKSPSPSSSSSSSSNSTSISVNGAIIGGAVAGAVLLFIVICIVVAIIVVTRGATCCKRRKDTTVEKVELSRTQTTVVSSAAPSYFFGIGTTVRNDEKPSHPPIPDFNFVKVGSTIGRSHKMPAPDVVPSRLYPMAMPYDVDDVVETRAQPNQFSSADNYINSEMDY